MQSHLCSRGFFPWNPLSSLFCYYNSTLLPQSPPAESFPQPSCNESLSLVFLWRLKKILKTFIFGCAGSSLLSLVAASGSSSGQASHCGGFSCCRAQALGAQALVAVGHVLSSCCSGVVAHRPSCSASRGILPGQELNLRHLHWQVDSLPLSHQGSLSYSILSVMLPFSSVQFSHSVMSDSLRPHGLQHARPSCTSPTPGVYPNSCPLSR